MIKKWLLLVFVYFFSLLQISAMDEDPTNNEQRFQVRLSSAPNDRKDGFEENENSQISFILNDFPDSLLCIFSCLDVTDLGRISQVCKQWTATSSVPNLWRKLGLREYGEYLTAEDLRENPRLTVVSHYLSVWANILQDLQKINRLVRLYKLNLYKPSFKEYVPFIYTGGEEGWQLDIDFISEVIDREIFIAQGHRQAIRFKIEGLLGDSSRSIYEKDYAKAREFNDSLVERGDQAAIRRKLMGLAEGKYGYEKDLKALKEFNDKLIERGDEEAIARKVEALWRGGNEYTCTEFSYNTSGYGRYGNLSDVGRSISVRKKYPTYGYENNPREGKKFIETLVDKRNKESIKRKFEGLIEGIYGYEKNLDAARDFNETLVGNGDLEAIRRKIEGLTERKYGYECSDLDLHSLIEQFLERGGVQLFWERYYKSQLGEFGYRKCPLAARKINDFLIGKRDLKAIRRKVDGQVKGDYGYEKSPQAIRELNEILVENGDQEAIRRRIEGLTEGKYGYEKNPETARVFNDVLVIKGDQEAIKRKVEGLTEGKYGYEKNTTAAREFNDALVEKGDQEAIKRKVEGLWRGGDLNKYSSTLNPTYGYQKNPQLAREFNDALVEKGDQEAIRRKVEGLAGENYGNDEEKCKGKYGYEKNPEAAREFNDALVEQGHSEAIKRKIYGLRFANGGYGYRTRDYNAANELEDILIERGDAEAIKHRFQELNCNAHSENHSIAARTFIDSLVRKGNLEAKKRKIHGIILRQNGYELTLNNAKASIELDLISDSNPIARGIGHYLKALGLKYGLFGYEKDRQKAVTYIRQHNVPF